MRPKYFVTILILLALVVPASPVHAGGVVSICDEAHLRAALSGGGTVTFSCSGTIILTAGVTIAADTTIDGGGQSVTISGNNMVQVFSVLSGAALNLNELTVANGSAGFGGGGIYNLGTLIVSNSTFSGNRGENYGGGIRNDGTLNVSNCTFSGNYATSGGAILNAGMLTVTNSTFSGNGASYGAGITTGGTSIVGNSTFSENDAGRYGGGIYNEGILTVSNGAFSGNSVVNYGGGIYNGGTVTVSSSIFSGNSVDGVYGGGGGIHNRGTVTVSSSTFSGNSADSAIEYRSGGGGINNEGVLTVSNSTFFGNRATRGGGISNYRDGGIPNEYDGTVTVSNSTFSGNSATGDYGGGIYRYSGTVTLKNTIVANSPAGGNCSEAITDGGGNLSYPDTTCPGINRDPLLGALQNNGGPTETMALGPGSAALDAANDVVCAAAPVNNLDQRGIARPWGMHCDIGAVEQVPLKRIWLPTVRSW